MIKVDKKKGVRYYTPKEYIPIKNKLVKYKNAKLLAENTPLEVNSSLFAVIDGSFIFGDYIEALIIENDLKVKEMTICTLSYSNENVFSLNNTLEHEYVDRLNLIVSDYFFGNERRGLIAQAYKVLDKPENNFQLVVAGVHIKATLIELYDGRKFVIHGSPNLRTSANVEQFEIQENKEKHDFLKDIFSDIIDKYSTINHSFALNDKGLKSKEEACFP